MRRHRGRQESRRQTFELLQSDLEVITEMLSDVVARRRLRASKPQIVQATRAARSKRVSTMPFLISSHRSLFLLCLCSLPQFFTFFLPFSFPPFLFYI